MDFLQAFHSGWRWLVVLVGVLAAVYYLLVVLGVTNNTRLNRLAMTVFTITMDIQVTVGILFFIERLGYNLFQTYQLIHLGILLVATVFAHIASSRAKKLPAQAAARANLFALAIVAILIVVGVAALPYNGWRFSTRA